MLLKPAVTAVRQNQKEGCCTDASFTGKKMVCQKKHGLNYPSKPTLKHIFRNAVLITITQIKNEQTKPLYKNRPTFPVGVADLKRM